MSELEALADEIRALGAESGRELRLAESMAARCADFGRRLHGVAHLRGLDGLDQAYDSLAIAYRRSKEVAVLFEALGAAALTFADRLAGGAVASGAVGSGELTDALEAAVAPGSEETGSDAAGATGGTSERRGLPISPLSLTEIVELMPSINLGRGDPFDPREAYRVNCGNVAANLFDALNGGPVVPAGTGTLDIAEMNARTGRTQTPMTPAQIDSALRSAGPGAHAVVGIDRTDSGHWFNVYFDGERVLALDAQPNPVRVLTFPPDYEVDVVLWDVSI